MKPHKHAALIKAWADGAEIQVKSTITNEWIDVRAFTWSEEYEYRIKPEEKKTVVKYLWERDGLLINRFASEVEVVMNVGVRVYKRLDWSRTEFPE